MISRRLRIHPTTPVPTQAAGARTPSRTRPGGNPFPHTLLSTLTLTILLLATSARAQAPEPPPPVIEEQELPTPESTGLGTTFTPLPDEEVMRPTDHGLRFTPELAQAFALGWIHQNLGDSVELSPDQLTRFSQNIADRAMRLAHEDPEATRTALEALFESVLIRGRRNMDAQMAQQVAERMRPAIPRWRTFLDGIAADGENILTPQQREAVLDAVERRHRRLDRLDEMIERWANGEYREDDRLDRILEPGISDDEIEVPPGAPAHPGYRRAWRRANWHVQRIGPGEWLTFLTATRASLHFDAEQSARADQIYSEYKARAAAIMTPAWRESLRQNRALGELRWELRNLPAEPWLFRIEQEYRAMIKPIEELTESFQKEILALATDAQREAFINELRERFAAHGHEIDDADRAEIMALLR